MFIKNAKIRIVKEYAKAVLQILFWAIIFLSIFVPYSTDYWLPEGFIK